MKFLLFGFLCLVCLGSYAQNAQKGYNKAYKQFQLGAFEKCLKGLDQVLLIDSQFYKAYQLKSKIYEKWGQEDSVTKYGYLYSCTFKIDYHMWQSLAVRFFNVHQFDKAEECIQRAIQMHGNATLYNYQGVIQMQKKQFEEALVSFRKAFELDSLRESTLYNVGYAYVMLDSLSAAERHFVIALKMNKQFSLPYLGIAIVSYMNKDYPKTIDYCNLALANKGNTAPSCELYHYRALAYRKTGQLVRACLDFFALKNLNCEERYFNSLQDLCKSD